MADVLVNALTPIATEPISTDSIVCVNRSTNEGQIIDYNLLANVILAKLTTKTYTLDTTAQTLIGAINELDGRVLGKIGIASDFLTITSTMTWADVLDAMNTGDCMLMQQTDIVTFDSTFPLDALWGAYLVAKYASSNRNLIVGVAVQNDALKLVIGFYSGSNNNIYWRVI